MHTILGLTGWEAPIPEHIANGAVEALERGELAVMPDLRFPLSPTEVRFLSPACLDGKAKNISFRPQSGVVQGTSATGADRDALTAMLRRYYEQSSALIGALCPEYRGKISPGFTSFRPAEIAGRASSWRKDDTRLHVDAFPSRPLQGLRIMRVFTNVNPSAPRMWRVGEDFEAVTQRFVQKISPQLPGAAWLLRALRITKTLRTPYDHLMLGIHDSMKADERYQSECRQISLPIPPGATWACFTDSVSHAAMSGQFAFEQTFYLPVDAMRDQARSPLRILERLTGKRLVNQAGASAG